MNGCRGVYAIARSLSSCIEESGQVSAENNARIGSRKLQTTSIFSNQGLSRRAQARSKTQKATNNTGANETSTTSPYDNATQSGRKVAEDLGRTTRTASAEKSHTLNGKSTSTNAEPSSASSANPKSKANDAPLQYQNSPSSWTDTSFLSPYLRKHPGLYNSAKFLYDGLGLYSKQGDSVRLGKKVYLDCCDQDIIEEKWIYEGDWELAGAIWRNIFDAKGWDLGGKTDEAGNTVDPQSASHPLKDTPVTQTMDDKANNATTGQGSTLTEIPYHVYYFVAYLRRELKRLEAIPDEEIIQAGSIGIWGRMDGLGSGDEILETRLTPKELESWEKMSEEAGTYR
ncbi:1661_t:CDS:2 [Acaulospora colombiana]|uniref:1661_t:CDS:1 n=1 Tax=Acaulospora colombiana TaxID=27376 RepID=A0ACA9NJX6_9GLOM|nr:1661_t:CDS:2 [Acaulospora colombiana]